MFTSIEIFRRLVFLFIVTKKFFHHSDHSYDYHVRSSNINLAIVSDFFRKMQYLIFVMRFHLYSISSFSPYRSNE